MTKTNRTQINRAGRELNGDELKHVSGGARTNGDNPFVQAVMEAYFYTVATSQPITFPLKPK